MSRLGTLSTSSSDSSYMAQRTRWDMVFHVFHHVMESDVAMENDCLCAICLQDAAQTSCIFSVMHVLNYREHAESKALHSTYTYRGIRDLNVLMLLLPSPNSIAMPQVSMKSCLEPSQQDLQKIKIIQLIPILQDIPLDLTPIDPSDKVLHASRNKVSSISHSLRTDSNMTLLNDLRCGLYSLCHA